MSARASTVPEVVLLAGGAGVRLWPVSREQRPKQFFELMGESLLEEAFNRAHRLCLEMGGAAGDFTHIWAVVTEPLVAPTTEELAKLSRQNLLVEPVRRNTAAAIGWAAVEVRRRAGETAVLAVFPADHHVASPGAFARAAARATALAASGAIVTIGIPPTRAETGFGWLETGAPIAGAGEGDAPAFELARFVEKPDRARAESFLAAPAGRFLWNAGIFFFRADRILEEIARHMPVLGRALDEIAADPACAGDVYRALPPDLASIDYGVMERAAEIACVAAPADVGWNDVGSWAALREVFPRDAQDNVVLGEAVLIDTANSLIDVRAGPAVAVVGLRDVCVVATGDAILVCSLDQAQRVREVVDELRKRGNKEVL